MTPAWLKHHKRELENVMGDIPTTSGRQSFRPPEVAVVQSLLYAQYIDETTLNAVLKYHAEGFVPFHGNLNEWCLLLSQGGILPSNLESLLMDPR